MKEQSTKTEKEMILKIFLRLTFTLVLILISIPVFNAALHFISMNDTAQMVLGFVILFSMGTLWFLYLRYLVKFVNKQLSMLSLIILLLSGCGRTVIEPGHVGIVVNSYGSNKGVSDYPVVTGVQWYNPFTTSILQYPDFVQSVSWTKDPGEGHPANEEISFNTGDQMVVYADISLSYQLDQSKVPAFYVKFRADKIDSWTHGFLRNLTRQKFDEVAGKYKIEQIMGDNAPFLKEVKDQVQKELDPVGVQIGVLGFNGSPRPPQAVIEAINGKVKATQDAIRIENEVRSAHAEAEKAVVKAEGEAKAAIAKADGEAKANQLVNSSLSSNLLEWRRLDISQNATVKWDGQLPNYVGSGTMPFIQLPSPKQ